MLNLTSLNQRVNALTAKVNTLSGSANLAGVLTAGNSAGTNDIDMNNQDILNVNNIDVVTINGSTYPPAVEDLSTTLLAGNTADNSIILTDGVLETMTLQKKQLTSANDDGTGILTNATLKNDFGGQQFLSFGSSVPFGYSNNLSVQLASGGSGCGISHFDSFPTPSDLTISTDQNLTLSSSKNLTLTADNIDLSTAGTLIIPSPIATNYLQYTQPTSNFKINQGTTGGVANPIISLNQNDTASGACNITFYKNTFTNGSAIGELTFRAKTAITGNPEREYARIGGAIRSNTSGNVDGSITLQARINDTLTELMRINGQDAQIEIFQPLDLNDKDIVSSIGDIELNATASAGNGKIILRPKEVSGLETISMPLTSSATDELVIEKSANMTDFYQVGGAIPNTSAQMRLGNGGLRMVSINVGVAPTFGLDNASFQTATHQFIGTNYNLTLPSAGEVNFINANLDMNGGSITTTSSNQTNTFSAGSLTIDDTTNPSNTEQVNINATTIQFTSSGSTSDSLSMYNDSADGGEIIWYNSTGSNGLTIESNQSLTLKSTNASTPINLESDIINFQNTDTTTTANNHTSSLGTTSNIGDITNYLKFQLNGVDIWVPYFTSDPSL